MRPVPVRLRLALIVAVAVAASLLPMIVTSASAANSVTVFYKPAASWSITNIHYAATGGAWTIVPGVLMDDAACTGWKRKTIDLGAATGAQAVFNNGSGTWDNNGGANYALGLGAVTVASGVIGSGNPCGTTTPTPTPTPTPSRCTTSPGAPPTSITSRPAGVGPLCLACR